MGETQRVIERIEGVASPILWTLGLELVEVVCVGQGSRTIVRIFIDKPGGVTLQDCERAHVALGPALDVADPFPYAYTLEVSSPGLDRPLRRLSDYRRVVGQQLRLKLKQPVDGQWRITGQLLDADEQSVTLMTGREGREGTIRLELNMIAEAKLEVTF